jgi:hypothetical protein
MIWNPCITVAEDEKECKASKGRRRQALVISHGNELAVEEPDFPFEKKTWGDGEAYYVLQDTKPVLYVPNFLNTSTAQELQSFCMDRFVRSPIRGNFDGDSQNGDLTQAHAIRTSESCAMVPAFTYLSNPRFQTLRQDENPATRKVIREVDVAWEVSKRAASLLLLSPEMVEPLQIVRYTSPDAFYKVHHDHGGFYGKTMEQRPWTVLVFLNDVENGGYTYFPKLDLRVAPRGGDAIAWSNVDSNNKADPDMVHAGEPPGAHGIEKYALNIWLGESSLTDYVSKVAGGKWGTRESSSQVEKDQ